MMTHRQRALTALKGEIPDSIPTFELVFHETERDFDGRLFFGKWFPFRDSGMREAEAIRHQAELYIDVARRFEHSLIMVSAYDPHADAPWTPGGSQAARFLAEIRDRTGDEFALFGQASATFNIPADPMPFVEAMYDRPDELHEQARKRVEGSACYVDQIRAAGGDGVIECSDYAMNSGPFLAPEQFAEFVTPYLTRAVDDTHDHGLVFVKHSDGNLMPVIDQLVGSGIDALHSIDPMAGMDIKHIKETYGGRVALCGNVHCAHMQTGTPEEIRESAEYCIKHGKPGGGYIFSTSNCVFRGMPLESYDLIQEVWKEHRTYESAGSASA